MYDVYTVGEWHGVIKPPSEPRRGEKVERRGSEDQTQTEAEHYAAS